MLLRPMPATAKVGAIAVLILAILGAVLLPMAVAQTRTAPPRFAANLPHGISIELVGVCNWATGKPTCWKADGSSFDMSMHAREWNRPRATSDYGFMFKVTGRSDADLTWAIDEAQGASGSTDIVDAQGNRLEGYKAITASMTKAPRQTTMRVGLAAGPWCTTWTHDGKAGRADGGDAGGVLWSQAFGDSDGLHVVASTAGGSSDADRRIVAVDANGKVYTASSTDAPSVTNISQLTATFQNLKRDDVREFRMQVRPYQWVVFEGVSLQPGVTTSPHVQTSSWPAASPTPSNTTAVQPAERAESAKVDIAIGDKDLVVTRLSDRLFEARILIRNNRSVPLPRFRVHFYAGDPDKGGRLLSPQQAGPIMSGASWGEYNPALELRPGESVISVIVDPDNRVEESDETNNKASQSLSGLVSESEQVARVGAIGKLDLSGDDLFQVEAEASKGFHFPYYLFVPAGIDKDSPAYLLVETNNSGMVSDNWEVHRARALTLVKTSYANRMARRLGSPLLVPTFPRPRPETHGWAYTHALDIDTLEIEEGELRRIDLQLTAMIQHAQELLRTSGFQIHAKVFMHGFSASAKFCNRYCYLHPEMVKAAAAGGVNGLPTLPVREWNGYELPFPIGLAGIEKFTGKPFDEKAFRQVAQYIYMGSSDTNDTLLSPEAWREEEAAIIRKALAAEKMMPDRWEVSQKIYRQQQLPAQLVTYDGVGHSIQSEMLDDVLKFFQANAGEKYVPIEPSAVRR